MANRLKMAMVQTILRLLEQGWSLRRIGRVLEVDRAIGARLAAESKPATDWRRVPGFHRDAKLKFRDCQFHPAYLLAENGDSINSPNDGGGLCQ